MKGRKSLFHETFLGILQNKKADSTGISKKQENKNSVHEELGKQSGSYSRAVSSSEPTYTKARATYGDDISGKRACLIALPFPQSFSSEIKHFGH